MSERGNSPHRRFHVSGNKKDVLSFDREPACLDVLIPAVEVFLHVLLDVRDAFEILLVARFVEHEQGAGLLLADVLGTGTCRYRGTR